MLDVRLGGTLFTLIGFLIWGLQVGGTVGVILVWRHFRPGDPPSVVSVLGPPAIVGLGGMGLTVPLIVGQMLLTGGWADRPLQEVMTFAGMLALSSTVSAAWGSAANYGIVGALMAISPRVRADAPWLLRSAGVAGAFAVALTVVGFAVMIFGLRGLGGD